MVDGLKKCVFVCCAHHLEDFLQRLPNVLVGSPSDSGPGGVLCDDVKTGGKSKEK